MKKELLRNQVIVITGASSGFGKGAAMEFARAGANLVLAARRTELIEELAMACQAAGGRSIAVSTNVSKREDVEQLFAKAIEEFGRIDVWINNAGAGAIGRFEDVPLDDHVQVIETDLLGTIYGSYFAMRQFRQQNRGTLINVSSLLGELPNPYYASYVAAKHGVSGLSAALRLELKENKIDNVHVCTVLPTSTDTPFFEHAANYSGHEFQPTPPVYDPQEVVDVIVNLASEPEDEVAVGTAAKAAILAHRIAPGATESRFGKQTHDTLQKAPPAPPTDGSLQEPSQVGAGVKGSRTKK